MARVWRRWQKEANRRLTIMVIPHGVARPRQISLPIPFLAVLFVSWTVLTGWAGFAASERFDYWRARVNSHFLKMKLTYLNNQVSQSRAMMDEVKTLEAELRTLIGLGSREAIIQTDPPSNLSGPPTSLGGPSLEDANALERSLQSGIPEIRFEEMARSIRALRSEAEERLAGVRALNHEIDSKRKIYRATPNLWPVSGYLTSHFGSRLSPIDGFRESHQGMDIAGPEGSPIRVTADGVVKLAGWAGGYGNVVVVDHGLGYSTRYGHNRQVVVKTGDRVKRGQVIALMGQTGKATGPHCHYEVWYNGHAVNPSKFLIKHTS
ncbi:MAG: peptidoglycan DD-metalloendopeptidase family protein [Elusimicrobia bacterium]|jgi:murein DD-endopeptidase MepM/ murein hydrolase activator NlpD|nr:peptidoglycan DD-metalloendopeptidase family protein [Elusimicrobiota bacterium]